MLLRTLYVVKLSSFWNIFRCSFTDIVGRRITKNYEFLDQYLKYVRKLLWFWFKKKVGQSCEKSLKWSCRTKFIPNQNILLEYLLEMIQSKGCLMHLIFILWALHIQVPSSRVLTIHFLYGCNRRFIFPSNVSWVKLV